MRELLTPSRSVTAAAVAAATLLAALTAEAEWDRQRMNPQDAEKGFLQICAVSSSFAVAAGAIKQGSSDAGAIFVTRDGLNWANNSPPTSGGPMDIHIYLSCYFADELNGAVGGLGEIVVTHDGAATWTRVGLGGLFGGRSINDLTGLGAGQPAFAATSTGQILRSDDGGASWPEWARPLGDVNLVGVLFTDSDHGWVHSGVSETDEESGEVTAYADGGLALTTDGGESWQTVFSGEARQVIALHFIDDRRGWMLSRSMTGTTFERTTDGGLTWEPASAPAESSGGQVVGYNDVYFFDACEGMILGVLNNNDWGTVWRTTDGGASWVEFDREFLRLGELLGFPVEASMTTFDFVDRTVGWASGSNETVFRYDAEDDGPTCDGGGDGDADGDADGDGGGGGGRCSCRAPGGRAVEPGALLVGLAFAVVLALILGRRRVR